MLPIIDKYATCLYGDASICSLAYELTRIYCSFVDKTWVKHLVWFKWINPQ